jgi:hypothetical protein
VVNLLSAFLLWGILAVPSHPAAPAPEPVRSVFRGEAFPWYDADAGRVKPVLPYEVRFAWLDGVVARINRVFAWIGERLGAVASWFRWLNRWRLPGVAGAGDLLMIGLAMLFLTVVLVLLLELLRRYRPLAEDAAARTATIRAGSAQRIEGLPAGVRLDSTDPWAEAQRLRARGDYAGAVVYLFAHQLLSLERLKQLRLVPGRTGRQLVRAVGDRQIRGLVEPTLRLFEGYYYGHRVPSAEAFETVWSLALQFQSRLTAAESAS